MIGKISDQVYEQILEHSIISALDGIILHDGKILLAKRTQEPAKGEWWIPGGRQIKGENPERGIIRKIKEETNLDVEIIRFICVEDVIFDKTNFLNVQTGVHYVTRIYLVAPIGHNQDVQLNDTQKECMWIDKEWYEKNKGCLHKYVRKHLKDSGVFD